MAIHSPRPPFAPCRQFSAQTRELALRLQSEHSFSRVVKIPLCCIKVPVKATHEVEALVALLHTQWDWWRFEEV